MSSVYVMRWSFLQVASIEHSGAEGSSRPNKHVHALSVLTDSQRSLSTDIDRVQSDHQQKPRSIARFCSVHTYLVAPLHLVLRIMSMDPAHCEKKLAALHASSHLISPDGCHIDTKSSAFVSIVHIMLDDSMVLHI